MFTFQDRVCVIARTGHYSHHRGHTTKSHNSTSTNKIIDQRIQGGPLAEPVWATMRVLRWSNNDSTNPKVQPPLTAGGIQVLIRTGIKSITSKSFVTCGSMVRHGTLNEEEGCAPSDPTPFAIPPMPLQHNINSIPTVASPLIESFSGLADIVDF